MTGRSGPGVGSARRVTNLCFHGIGQPTVEREPGEARYWITADTYRRILDLVADRTDVALSFDDGNESDIEVALPELEERGLRAHFFPLAARLDELGSLSRAHLRSLSAAGMTIGTHGMHHRSWRGMSSDELSVELGDARQAIAAAVGRSVDAAACPLGAYDRRVLKDLRRRGYRLVMTSDRASTRRDAWLQPRFSVRAGDTVDDIGAILSGDGGPARRLGSRARILAKSLR